MPLQPLAPPTPLKWPEAGEASSDRNWVLFEQSGALYSVFSIEPHVVLRIGRGGTCEEKHRTSNRWFARRFAERAIHGGANSAAGIDLEPLPLLCGHLPHKGREAAIRELRLHI